MALWFMLRNERRMDKIIARMDGLKNAQHKQNVITAVLVRVLAQRPELPEVPPELADPLMGVELEDHDKEEK